MSWDINSVVLIGRLVRDPELRHSQSGYPFCNFSIAVNRGYTSNKSENAGDNLNYSPQKEDEVYYFNVTALGKNAELCAKYLLKGTRVCVQGYLQQRRIENAETKKLESRVTVVLDRIQFLSLASSGASTSNHSEKHFSKESYQRNHGKEENVTQDIEGYQSKALDHDEAPY